ncbi:MAG: S9 family peptidase, partial [Caulobacteraceae bacterium]
MPGERSMRQIFGGLACAILLVWGTISQAASAPTSAPLIARSLLFGNPSRTQGRISPDGKWLSWMAPRDGVMNVWVAPAADPSKARPLTNEKTRPIRQHSWSPDSSMVLFVNDKGGDENFVLYGVDLATGAEKTFTNFPKTRVVFVGASHTIKDRILIGLNNRDQRWFDVYSLTPKTGELVLLMRNDGFAGFLIDDSLQVRVARKPLPTGGTEFYRVAGGKVEAKPFDTVGFEDAATTAPVSLTADGKTLYWVDSRGRDTVTLIAQDIATGAKTLVAENSKADIVQALVNPATGRIEAFASNYLKVEWTAIDPAVKGDLDFLKSRLKGEVGVVFRTDADDRWLVGVDPVTGPSVVYVYDRKPKRLTQLYVGRPELTGAILA